MFEALGGAVASPAAGARFDAAFDELLAPIRAPAISAAPTHWGHWPLTPTGWDAAAGAVTAPQQADPQPPR